MFKRIMSALSAGNTESITNLKLQGDKKNGIFIVNEFYRQNGKTLTDSDIHEHCFDSMDNSAVELTDPNLIGMAQYYYFEELDNEQLKEHVDKTYFAHESEQSEFIENNLN